MTLSVFPISLMIDCREKLKRQEKQQGKMQTMENKNKNESKHECV